MTCTLQNKKGLFARCSPVALIYADRLDALRKLIQEQQIPVHDPLAQLVPLLAQLPCTLSISGQYPSLAKNLAVGFHCIPQSWVNETQEIDLYESQAQKEQELAPAIARLYAQTFDGIELRLGSSLAQTITTLFEGKSPTRRALPIGFLAPKSAVLKNLSEAVIKPAGPEVNAQDGIGWAIWMERGQGWMDHKKRPAQACSEARLFESAAAALRTAKAAGFGSNTSSRGPALIVQIALEPVEILVRETRNGTNLAVIEGALAKRESDEIEKALLLDWESALTPSAQDLKPGTFEGCAIWIEGNRQTQTTSGFKNQRNDAGPLGGAQLHSNTAQALQHLTWYNNGCCIVKIIARPTAISENLEQANTAPVLALIAQGQAHSTQSSIAKAAASPAAATRPRSRAL